MAEALAVVGGIASVAQITDIIFKTVNILSTFSRRIHDAPREFKQCEYRLKTIASHLQDIEIHILNPVDEDFVPASIRVNLLEAVETILQETEQLQTLVFSKCVQDPRSFRKRLRWAVFDRKTTEEGMQRIRASEEALSHILTLLVCRSVLTMAAMLRATARRRIERSAQRAGTSIRASITEVKSYSLKLDSWMRKSGVYGSYNSIALADEAWISRIIVGLKLPGWLCLRSLLVDLKLGNLLDNSSGFSLLSGQIRLQNRVPMDSPFMTACKRGDVTLIKQHLDARPSCIWDKSWCTGKTPLHIAIEGRSFPAIKLLLEQGADPNMSDDDLVPPSFTLMGMQPNRRKMVQIPPQWARWLDVLRLLFSHGAAADEVALGKTLGMLNINYHDDHENNAAEYLGLLTSRDFVDFDASDGRGVCPMATAIGSQGVDAIKIVKRLGVNPTKVRDDGSSYLHLAASQAPNNNTVEYLFSNGCSRYLNKQDTWGWTPLHHAIFSAWSGYRFSTTGRCEARLTKVRFLASQNPDLSIKGVGPLYSRLQHPDDDSEDSSSSDEDGDLEASPIELVYKLDRVYPRNGDFSRTLCEVLGLEVLDIFYDAVDIH